MTQPVSRRSFVAQAGLASLAWVARAAPANPAAASTLPPFSWDRVPVYGHLGKTDDDFSAGELEFLARHFDFVTIEKGQAVKKRGCTEEGIYEAVGQLKRLNPQMTVLFYWNTFINYPTYRAVSRFQPQWRLKDIHGRDVKKPGAAGPWLRPDLSLPEVRGWWSDVAAQAMAAAPLDGIFADALPQVLTPALAQQVGAAKARALAAGLEEMLALTRSKMGPGKLLLVNGLRESDYRQILDWKGVGGAMIEHFGAFIEVRITNDRLPRLLGSKSGPLGPDLRRNRVIGCAGINNSTSPEAMRADLESLAMAAARGKFAVLKGWPDFNFTDAAMMARPHDELLRRAREQITFPLACFLVAAQPHSYFCYSWGYRQADGMLESYPELDRPLGPPQGDAVWQGTTATRRFDQASVQVDLQRRTARIDWGSPTSAPR